MTLERGAAAGVAVELGHDHAVELGRLGELLGDVDRVLAGHRVDREQDVVRADPLLDRDQLVHQLAVDVEATGGVDDQDVGPLLLDLVERPAGDLDRIGLDAALVAGDLGLLGEPLQLLDGGGALGVAGGDGDGLLLLAEVAGELRGRGRLAGALKPRHQDHRRALRGEHEVAAGAAHQLGQLLVDDLDDHLAGIEALEDPLADRLLADSGDEGLRDLVVDVGLEQGETDLAHRLVDVVLAQLSARAQVRHRALEALGELVEH